MKAAAVAIVLAIAIGIGGFFLGKREAGVKEPQAFVLSSRITPEMLLGSAHADITELVEVCPTRDWLIFTGVGRALLMGANTYHYAVAWEPQTDIKATAVRETPGTFDIDVTVRKLKVTMNTNPTIRAWVLDDSLFVDMKKQTAELKDLMLKRMSVSAVNKLSQGDSKELFVEAVRTHLYSIYASEATKIRNINVRLADGAIPPTIPNRWDNECASRWREVRPSP
jgi:hypothetical protein